MDQSVEGCGGPGSDACRSVPEETLFTSVYGMTPWQVLFYFFIGMLFTKTGHLLRNRTKMAARCQQ